MPLECVIEQECIVEPAAECTVEGFKPDKNKGSGKAGRGEGNTPDDIRSSGEGNRNSTI
jgi:hypothetical protein